MNQMLHLVVLAILIVSTEIFLLFTIYLFVGLSANIYIFPPTHYRSFIDFAQSVNLRRAYKDFLERMAFPEEKDALSLERVQ